MSYFILDSCADFDKSSLKDYYSNSKRSLLKYVQLDTIKNMSFILINYLVKKGGFLITLF